MNICVIGLGSMGKRRIRIIQEIYPAFEVIGIDGRADRCKEAEELFSINCYSQIADVSEKNIDCAFICTSPLSHSGIIKECLIRRWNVFTELNLVSDGYEELMKLAKEGEVELFLSSTFFYREEIRYIRDKIDEARRWNYIYHIGQYLPDWHPWENYRDFFLGDKRTNGCREIMAIELPWLINTFGNVKNLQVMRGKMSQLDIDYNDKFLILFEHENGNSGCLIVDVVSPAAVRKLEVYSEGAYMSWSGTPDSLEEYDPLSRKTEKVQLIEAEEHIDGYQSFVVENAYKNEVKEFFDVVMNGKEPLYGFEQDKAIIELIDKIGA